MSRPSIRAFALLSSLVVLPLAAACSPVPSKGEGGEKPAAGPQPDALCKHVRELADIDTDDAAVLDQVERECVESLTGLQTRYETFATCVEAATDAKTLSECEQPLAKPKALLSAVGPGAKVEAVCDHVLTMLEKELGNVGSPMQASELEQLRTQCVTDATKQVEAKGLEAFDKEADCILAAQNIEALQACGV